MSQEVLVSTSGGVGHVSLNRPKAIHALNRFMCETIIEALLAWRNDPTIKVVMLDHAEGRGFCAGGDIRMIAESGKTDGKDAAAFFYTEYQLNHLLFTYPKPIVAFMDGITMGGGVGISQPARFRIATENTRFAMPETGIGLFPDVGGGWYLSRLPGKVGEFLALTGARLDGAECCALGLATHYMESENLADLKAAIVANSDGLEKILANAAQTPPPARVEGNRDIIDRLFAASTVEGILADLEADGGDWAMKELKTLRSKSPQSCKVSLRLVQEARDKSDFAEEMVQEYAIGGRIVRTHDFIEGVRALIVDKDNEPRWDPADMADVTDTQIDALFAPLPEGESWRPLG